MEHYEHLDSMSRFASDSVDYHQIDVAALRTWTLRNVHGTHSSKLNRKGIIDFMIDINNLTTRYESIEIVPAISEATDSEDRSVENPAEEEVIIQNDLQEMSKSRQEMHSLKMLCEKLAVERELALALNGEGLLQGVATQLMYLWKDKFVARQTEKHGFEILSFEGRTVSETVKEWLRLPEYRHFLAANSRGGVARKSESNANEFTSGSTKEMHPRSLNEYVIHQWRQRSQLQRKDENWSRFNF